MTYSVLSNVEDDFPVLLLLLINISPNPVAKISLQNFVLRMSLHSNRDIRIVCYTKLSLCFSPSSSLLYFLLKFCTILFPKYEQFCRALFSLGMYLFEMFFYLDRMVENTLSINQTAFVYYCLIY